MSLQMKKPEDCSSIAEIREEIDKIDRSIMELMAKRQEYVEEIVKYKTDPSSVIARERQLEVFATRRKWAEELGLSPDFIELLFKHLVQHNIEKELKLLKK